MTIMKTMRNFKISYKVVAPEDFKKYMLQLVHEHEDCYGDMTEEDIAKQLVPTPQHDSEDDIMKMRKRSSKKKTCLHQRRLRRHSTPSDSASIATCLILFLLFRKINTEQDFKGCGRRV